MKRNIIFIGFVLAALILVSCNIFGKKAQPQETRKKFTLSELDSLGVNMDHIFIFSDTSATYNGKPFQMGMTIGELCEIFGEYDRMPTLGVFIWDSIGVTMTTLDALVTDQSMVNGLIIDWNIDLRISGIEDPELREWCPRKYFTGNIIVGEAALGRGMQVKEFLGRTSLDFPPGTFSLLHYCDLNDWDYRKTELLRINYFTYRIRESESQDNIESFNMAISSRMEIYKEEYGWNYETTYHKDYPERFDHKAHTY